MEDRSDVSSYDSCGSSYASDASSLSELSSDSTDYLAFQSYAKLASHVLFTIGADVDGTPIILFTTHALPFHSRKASLYVQLLSPLLDILQTYLPKFIIVVSQEQGTSGRVRRSELKFMMNSYMSIPRVYKKALRSLWIVNASASSKWIGLVLKIMAKVVSRKGRRKLHCVPDWAHLPGTFTVDHGKAAAVLRSTCESIENVRKHYERKEEQKSAARNPPLPARNLPARVPSTHILQEQAPAKENTKQISLPPPPSMKDTATLRTKKSSVLELAKRFEQQNIPASAYKRTKPVDHRGALS